MTINNKNDLKNAFSKVLQQGLIQTSERIKSIIDSYLDSWYNDYSPVRYRRTETFLNSCLISELKQKGKEYFIDVYIDTKKLEASYKVSSSYVMRILNNADQGIHGVESPQVGDNDIRFWSNAIDDINYNKKAVILAGFIEYAKSQGIPISLK